MKKKWAQKQKGFSIIETLVALFLLSVGVMAVVQLFASTAVQAGENERYLTAMGLAQEGVELVRTIRNDNIVQEKSDDHLFDGIDETTAGECISAYPAIFREMKLCDVDSSQLSVPVVKSPADPAGYNRYIYANLSLVSPSAEVNTAFPFFWRKVYVKNVTLSGKTAKKITSVVFYKKPSSFPSEANIGTQCTLAKNCVYVSAILQ